MRRPSRCPGGTQVPTNVFVVACHSTIGMRWQTTCAVAVPFSRSGCFMGSGRHCIGLVYFQNMIKWMIRTKVAPTHLNSRSRRPQTNQGLRTLEEEIFPQHGMPGRMEEKEVAKKEKMKGTKEEISIHVSFASSSSPSPRNIPCHTVEISLCEGKRKDVESDVASDG